LQPHLGRYPWFSFYLSDTGTLANLPFAGKQPCNGVPGLITRPKVPVYSNGTMLKGPRAAKEFVFVTADAYSQAAAGDRKLI
jgi:hypothetical protein